MTVCCVRRQTIYVNSDTAKSHESAISTVFKHVKIHFAEKMLRKLHLDLKLYRAVWGSKSLIVLMPPGFNFSIRISTCPLLSVVISWYLAYTCANPSFWCSVIWAPFSCRNFKVSKPHQQIQKKAGTLHPYLPTSQHLKGRPEAATVVWEMKNRRTVPNEQISQDIQWSWYNCWTRQETISTQLSLQTWGFQISDQWYPHRSQNPVCVCRTNFARSAHRRSQVLLGSRALTKKICWHWPKVKDQSHNLCTIHCCL